ncbi:MAG: hypothetical protein ACOVN0_21140 [Niveispirillum sp.]|uniref:hypothetical protein n=1 Tax=Niveispirillum sp. TaxID=1917217 RepID=UPI003BA7C41C
MIATAQAPAGLPRPVAAMPPLRRWLAMLFRRHPQTYPPLAGVSALISEQALAVTEVNGAGMCVVGYRGLLNPQDRFSFVLSLDGTDIAGDAVVAWRRHGGLGAAFYDVSAAERDRLGQWLSRRGDTG